MAEPLQPLQSVNVERRTVTPVVVGETVSKKTTTTNLDWDGKSNILHSFRSFTYNFTLAALKKDHLENPDSIRKSKDFYVIAKSSGKLGNDINYDDAPGDAKKLIEGFNSKSPGSYDMFINNVDIETLMAFSKTTNLSMATKISFEIYEPVSINGFIEALQVSARAAGHKGYMASPFLLLMEFTGYPDTQKTASDNAVKLDDRASRYFVITITTVEAEMSELGTRYKVNAVAHNELGFSTITKSKHPLQVEGKNVGELLENLMKALEDSAKTAIETDQAAPSGTELVYDKFSIVFPSKNGETLDYNTKNEKVYNATLVEDLSSPQIFSFPKPGETKYDAYKGRGSSKGSVPTNFERSSVIFAAGSSVQDMISAIIRDSTFCKDIVKKVDGTIQSQMVEYIHISVESIPLDKWNTKTLRNAYHYRFVIIPYKMHYSRIPLFQKFMSESDQRELEHLYVKRTYDYLYTGQNVDVRKFNLKFNNLFFQAYPQGMSNSIFSNPQATTKITRQGKDLPKVGEDDSEKLTLPMSMRIDDPAVANVTKYGSNAGRRDSNTYDALVDTMHRAILDNLDMVSCELEILGDPYFLVTGGNGNYRPKIVDPGITENGEAPYHANDVIIVLNFKTPMDINDKGIADFSKAPFSGCFRVIKVQSKFSDGMFTQRLFLIRIPGQPDDTTLSGSRVSRGATDKTQILLDVDLSSSGEA